MKLDLLFIGDTSHNELAATTAVLRKEVGRWRECRTIQQGVGTLSRGFWPQVILLAQPRAGDVSPAGVQTLLRASPLSRVVWLLGSWALGAAGLQGRPGPHAYAWTEVEGRLLRDLRRWAAARRCPLDLPDTAGPEEVLERIIDVQTHTTAPAPLPARVAVCSVHDECATLLVDALTPHVGTVVAVATDDLRRLSADVMVWDVTPHSRAALEQLDAFRIHAPDAPVVAITQFPRRETIAALMQCGAAAVLVKPVLIDNLVQRVRALLTPHPLAMPADLRVGMTRASVGR